MPPKLPDFAMATPSEPVLSARVDYCERSARSIDGVAAWLEVRAAFVEDMPTRALSKLARMASEITAAVIDLYSVQKWYAGAALVRQLIEVEYLLFRIE